MTTPGYWLMMRKCTSDTAGQRRECPGRAGTNTQPLFQLLKAHQASPRTSKAACPTATWLVIHVYEAIGPGGHGTRPSSLAHGTKLSPS